MEETGSVSPAAADNPFRRARKALARLWKGSRYFRIGIIAAAVLAAAALAAYAVYGSFFDPHRHEVRDPVPTKPLDTVLTPKQAADDMKYVYDRVSERHPIWIDSSDDKAAAFEETYAEQCEYLALKGDSVTVLDEWRSIAALLAVLGDAHTYSNARPENEPVLTVSESDALSDSAVLVAVNGRSVDTLYAGFKTMCSYESEVWALSSFERAVVREPWLRALGVDTSGKLIFEYSDDRSIKQAVYRFEQPEEDDQAQESDSGAEQGSCSYTLYPDPADRERSTALLRLESCRYDDAYKQTVDSFFADVKANGINNVIVDLRDNPGGNSMVSDYFIGYLDTESYVSFGGVDVRLGSILRRNESQRVTVIPKRNTFSGNVYVLTSAETFSAALDFAVMIADNGLGTVVGEQPGGMPSSYGDIVVFQTPNAGVLFQVSYKYFHRIDSSKDDQPLIPDAECPAGEAYDYALELIAGNAA